MEFLYNPNVAYLLLVIGMLLAVLAIFSPGTGMLEVGALFILLLAGWGIYNSDEPINIWAIIVLLLGLIPFVLAVRRSASRIYLAIAILAFVVGSAYLFQGEDWWRPGVNPLLAFVVSLLAGGYLWLAAHKVIEARLARPSHDLEVLIGETGEAKTDILAEGSVQVAGELWSAWSKELIPNGTPVRVVGRQGFILEVEKV